MTRELSSMEKIMLAYGAIQDPNVGEKEIVEAVTKQPEVKTFGEMLQANNPRSNINAHLNVLNGYAKNVGENDPTLHKDARQIMRLEAEREALNRRVEAIHNKYK
ncbi:hypothetical protein [Bacillus sp. XF8]|uniref:Uncharacterized protein n=1 Tax=Bacillus bingmayongensis TaxID=1150157 RepID=A0ABU5K1E9_9BACI|nr:hypothetical protein [Bacillus sp. XF8]MBO1582968.1 hypothetical protein [Bacillus sp. XF8]MDZ5609485.1 hypothetical protein [Bacillus pseudomycoides]